LKTQIKFYSGLNTIGGLVMSIVYGSERVLLEIGCSYEPATDTNDGVVLKRKAKRLPDMLRLKEAPLVEGLYSAKDLGDFPLQSAEDSPLHTSIFITHMHLDHMSCMGLVADNVDVYLSEPAQRLEKALEDVGQGVVTLRSAPYKLLDPDKEYQLGDITLKPFLLNSASYQDYSFYVKTPDMKIHHTGDVMLHGNYVDAVWSEMEYLKKEEIDLLVCESTSLMDSTMEMIYGDANAEIVGAPEVPQGMLDHVKVTEFLCEKLMGMKGLCVFNYYEREMSQVQEFLEMGRRSGRIVAFEPETAWLVWKFFGESVNVYVPDVDGYDTWWFKELCENNPVLDKKDIFANPAGYLIQNTYKNSMELFELPNENACYLHSGGTPIGAYDPAYRNLQNILSRAGFTHVNFFMDNYFTHAYPSQLKYYVDCINAKVLVPAHGKNPERLLAPEGRQRLLPKAMSVYEFDGEKLVEVE